MKKLTTLLSMTLLAFMALSVAPTTHAYGAGANWQIGFAGTATLPGGGGFGFWGWCTFVGVTSGTEGDCQITQYFHSPSGGVTCHTSVDVTGWVQNPGFVTPITGKPDFIITSGTTTVSPSSASSFCPPVLGDTGIPAAPGHYDLTSVFLLFAPPGAVGELQIQVTSLP